MPPGPADPSHPPQPTPWWMRNYHPQQGSANEPPAIFAFVPFGQMPPLGSSGFAIFPVAWSGAGPTNNPDIVPIDHNPTIPFFGMSSGSAGQIAVMM